MFTEPVEVVPLEDVSLHLELIPDDPEAKKEYLAFTWEVVQFEPRHMNLKLNFSSPLFVS